MVLFTVFNCQMKKSREFTEGIREENSVVSEPDGGDYVGDEINSKVGHLCCGELEVVAKFVDLVGVHPALLNTKSIFYGSHEDFIPLNECFPVTKSGVNVEETMTRGASKISIFNCAFLDNLVIGGLGIDQQCVEGFLGNIKAVLDAFSQQDCSQLMRRTRALKLCWSLSI